MLKISDLCVVTALLFCTFVFAYAKSRFSQDAAHIVLVIYQNGLLHYSLECLVETPVKLGMFAPSISCIVSYLSPFSSPHMSTDTGLIIFVDGCHGRIIMLN